MKSYPKHCVDCATGSYVRVMIDFKDVDHAGRETVVFGVEILRCDACGAELIPAESDRKISEAYRDSLV